VPYDLYVGLKAHHSSFDEKTNSCSYSTNDLVVLKFQVLIKILVGV